MARVVLAVAAPVVVKPAMELKKASTGPMTPARRNGAAPTNTTPAHDHHEEDALSRYVPVSPGPRERKEGGPQGHGRRPR